MDDTEIAPYTISLKQGVLYVTTSPLFSGGFHWAFVHIDPNGRCTRHHWARPRGTVIVPERYIIEILDEPKNKTNNTTFLGYFEVPDCSLSSCDDVQAVCQRIFPSGGYATTVENHQHGMTCRTWINGALALLTTQERANEVEARVTTRSTTLSEAHAKAFLGLAVAPATVVEVV